MLHSKKFSNCTLSSYQTWHRYILRINPRRFTHV